MADFERLVHFDDRDKLEKGPPGSIRTGPPEAPSALPVDDGEGPSYRRLLPSVCHPSVHLINFVLINGKFDRKRNWLALAGMNYAVLS